MASMEEGLASGIQTEPEEVMEVPFLSGVGMPDRTQTPGVCSPSLRFKLGHGYHGKELLGGWLIRV